MTDTNLLTDEQCEDIRTLTALEQALATIKLQQETIARYRNLVAEYNKTLDRAIGEIKKIRGAR